MMTLCPYHLSPLPFHRADIFIIPDLKILHPPYESLFLLGDLGEFLLKPPLFPLSLHLLAAQMLQLLGQLVQPLEIRLMFHLQPV